MPQDQFALGFLSRAALTGNDRDQDIAIQAVETISAAFLGMTVACAKCHDHVYDPVSQADYYSMKALFDPLVLRKVTLASAADLMAAGKAQAELERLRAPLEAERDALLDRIAEEDFNAQTIFLWVLYKLTSSVPIRDWSFWLEHPMWTEGDLRKAQLVFFSNSLADEFRMRLNSPEPLRELQENPMAFRWVTHFFADYETIQTGYMAHVLDVMATRIEVPLYYHGMRIMQHFMGGTWEHILPHAHKSVEAGYDPDAYPILISRYFQARFWVYYLEHGGWDPRLTSDYLRELQRINPEYHHLLGMEFLPIASIMGFTSPVLEILESQLSQIHYRGNWSAAVDTDLIRLAAMLAHARTGARSLFEVHRNSLLMGFWYKAYRKYLQGLYYASTLLIGEPDAEYEAPYRHFPGLARALQN